MAMNLLCACGSCYFFLFFEINMLRHGGGPIVFLVYLVEDYIRYPREKSGPHGCHVHKAFIIKSLLEVHCYSTSASSTRRKAPMSRHENV